jgi:hypothetical protein
MTSIQSVTHWRHRAAASAILITLIVTDTVRRLLQLRHQLADNILATFCVDECPFDADNYPVRRTFDAAAAAACSSIICNIQERESSSGSVLARDASCGLLLYQVTSGLHQWRQLPS